MKTKHPVSMVILACALFLLVELMYFLELLHFFAAPALCILLLAAVLEFCIVVERRKEVNHYARGASIWEIPHDAPISRLARQYWSLASNWNGSESSHWTFPPESQLRRNSQDAVPVLAIPSPN